MFSLFRGAELKFMFSNHNTKFKVIKFICICKTILPCIEFRPKVESLNRFNDPKYDRRIRNYYY